MAANHRARWHLRPELNVSTGQITQDQAVIRRFLFSELRIGHPSLAVYPASGSTMRCFGKPCPRPLARLAQKPARSSTLAEP